MQWKKENSLNKLGGKMTIIISKDGKNAQKIDKIPIIKENYLQKYLYNNPEVIPLYDYKEDIRILVVSREFSTKSGPIDAIGIDSDGEIYLIETKLYKNPDKRQVVAQVLDYGASLWAEYKDPVGFLNAIEEGCLKEFGISLQKKAQDFFELEEDEWQTLLENLKENIHQARFKFVVLMDKLHSRLKDLILFINNNSQFNIFAVEIEYYKYDEFEIIIPKLFGEEAAPDLGSRGKWTEQRFRQELFRRVGNTKPFQIVESILEFSKEHASLLDWGTGKESGSFTFKLDHPKSDTGRISLFTIWTSGNIRLRFKNIRKHAGDDVLNLYLNKLSALPIARNWGKKGQDSQSIKMSIEDAFPDKDSLESFKRAIIDFIKEVNKGS